MTTQHIPDVYDQYVDDVMTGDRQPNLGDEHLISDPMPEPIIRVPYERTPKAGQIDVTPTQERLRDEVLRLGVTYPAIPERTLIAIVDYVNTARPISKYIYAVLINDLRCASQVGDSLDVRSMEEVVALVRAELPSECWGSEDKILAWQQEKSREHFLAGGFHA